MNTLQVVQVNHSVTFKKYKTTQNLSKRKVDFLSELLTLLSTKTGSRSGILWPISIAREPEQDRYEELDL